MLEKHLNRRTTYQDEDKNSRNNTNISLNNITQSEQKQDLNFL